MGVPYLQLYGLYIISNVMLFMLAFILFSRLIYILPQKRRRRSIYKMQNIVVSQNFPRVALSVLWIHKEKESFKVRQQLLVRCGFRADAVYYYLIKRAIGIIFISVGILGYAAQSRDWLTDYVNPIYFILASIIVLLLLIFDKVILESLKKQRSERIIKEVYRLSNQLLYFSGSKMNLHSKLVRCIPYTTTIRGEMHLLTNEWYQDAAMAVRRFKYRLGTDEAFSFAETINSLRLHESDHYYDLLRQRIQDYKEKLELDKESKKETVSYILFIVAGIPIFNTFRLFIYPWVAQGQKLFDSLN